jgi:hypothetical protein
MVARAGLGIYPTLPEAARSRRYQELWDVACGEPPPWRPLRGVRTLMRGVTDDHRYGLEAFGARRWTWRLRVLTLLAVPVHFDAAPRHRIVKSVQLAFLLPWVAQRMGARVVLVRRHPLDTVASHLERARAAIAVGNPYQFQRSLARTAPHEIAACRARWGTPTLPDGASLVAERADTVGFLMSAYADSLEGCPNAITVDHEQLCRDTMDRFRELSAGLGLEWGDRAEEFLRESNRPGTGFRTERVAAELPGKWRAYLTTQEAEEARSVLRRYPIAADFDLS